MQVLVVYIMTFLSLSFYYVSPLTERWGQVGLPLSARLSILVCAVSLLCGQTRDVDPMLD